MTLALRTKTTIGAMLLLALGLVALLEAGPGAPRANAGGGCPNANAERGEASMGEFRKSMICLINAERANRGRRVLDNNAKLRGVAADHNAVMLQQDCFDHTCPGEASLTKRLRNAGYIKGDNWAYGETIGYDTTPRKMINAWMASPPNRSIILKGKFEDLGVSAAAGSPDPDRPDAPFVTYTAILGFVD